MKKICIALILILLISAVSCTSYREKKGTVIGEVVSVHPNSYFVYIKPVEDSGTKHLLEFRITDKTVFGSGAYGSFTNDIPELSNGAIIKINYTYRIDNHTLNISADSIKVVENADSSIGWQELVINNELDTDPTNISKISKGEVVYVAKITTPRIGYIIYVNCESDARLEQFFVSSDNKFLSDSLKSLLEQDLIGYTVEVQGIRYCFEETFIYYAFSVNSCE